MAERSGPAQPGIRILRNALLGRLSRRRYSVPEDAYGFESHLAKPDTKWH